MRCCRRASAGRRRPPAGNSRSSPEREVRPEPEREPMPRTHSPPRGPRPRPSSGPSRSTSGRVTFRALPSCARIPVRSTTRKRRDSGFPRTRRDQWLSDCSPRLDPVGGDHSGNSRGTGHAPQSDTPEAILLRVLRVCPACFADVWRPGRVGLLRSTHLTTRRQARSRWLPTAGGGRRMIARSPALASPPLDAAEL
jgi:hypothetical protein